MDTFRISTCFSSSKMVLANRRAKLPKPIRQAIQRVVRYFTFVALSGLTMWNVYYAFSEFEKFGDVTKCYGFNPGRLV
jgi:hypothetical protein